MDETEAEVDSGCPDQEEGEMQDDEGDEEVQGEGDKDGEDVDADGEGPVVLGRRSEDFISLTAFGGKIKEALQERKVTFARQVSIPPAFLHSFEKLVRRSVERAGTSSPNYRQPSRTMPFSCGGVRACFQRPCSSTSVPKVSTTPIVYGTTRHA